MKSKIAALILLAMSVTVEAKETKTIEVPNCWAEARGLAKRGTNIKTFEFGNDVVKTYGVTFDTPTHSYTLSCDQFTKRDQWMRIEKWTTAEIKKMTNETKNKTDKLAKQVGL